MSVRIKSQLSQQRSCIKFSPQDWKQKQESSSSLKQNRRLFQTPRMLDAVIQERKIKDMGAPRRTFGSGPSNSPPSSTGPLTPTPIKHLSKLSPRLIHCAVLSARSPPWHIITLAQSCPSPCVTLLTTMSLTCRIPQLECVLPQLRPPRHQAAWWCSRSWLSCPLLYACNTNRELCWNPKGPSAHRWERTAPASYVISSKLCLCRTPASSYIYLSV